MHTERIHELVVIDSSIIFWSYKDTLYRFENDSISKIVLASNRNFRIQSLTKNDNQLFVATNTKGVLVFSEQGKILGNTIINNEANLDCSLAYFDNIDKVWLVSESGLYFNNQRSGDRNIYRYDLGGTFDDDEIIGL